MQILLSWLREFVDWQGNVADLEKILIQNGIEVEAVEQVGIRDTAIVTAKVLSVEPHPTAERLRICTIFDGIASHQVVCGAPNVAKDSVVAYAPPGAVLPNMQLIEKRTIRGVESEGMICSEQELGVGTDHTGIMIFESTIRAGIPLCELFPNDVVVTIGITPNRADALSHYGVARIIAAATAAEARLPAIPTMERIPIPITIELPQPELCWRYAACLLEGVEVKPSPSWLVRRLERAGMRSRNVVVDVTNYVMLECGHPLHAFDAECIEGGRIVVRCADDAERLTTLDGVERQLDPSILCIRDANKPLAIAGIMGGANSAISESTHRVLLESAYFEPTVIRRAAKKLGLQTDASYRFERGTDIEIIPYALNRAATLIAELTGARISEVLDYYPTRWIPPHIKFRFRRAAQILGAPLDPATIVSTLTLRGFRITHRDDETITVNPPSYRNDVRAEIDLIEEVAIAHGYDTIEPSHHALIPFAALQVPEKLRVPPQKNVIRHMLAALGFHEMLTYNLNDPRTLQDATAAVEIANALGRERSVLRQWLLPTAIEVLAHNARHGAKSIRVFEIGKAFHVLSSTDSTIVEKEHLVVAMAGNKHERHWLEPVRPVDFYDIKGVIDTLLGRFGHQSKWKERKLDSPSSEWFEQPCFDIVVEGNIIGCVGQIHSRIARQYDLPGVAFVAELSLDMMYQRERLLSRYCPPSPYPPVMRDIALVVPKATPSDAIAAVIQEAAGELLRSIEPFDVFEHPSFGEDKKSIAFGLTFASVERTLTDEEVNAAIERILEAVGQQFQAQLRTL